MTSKIKIAKVVDNPDLVRDMESKAILANDPNRYNEHRQKKMFLKKIMNQYDELEDLKKDVAEIKQLLHSLLNINK